MSETIGTVQETSWRRMGIRAGLFFGACMTLFYAFKSTPWYTAILPGVFSGVMFGAIMAWFGRRQNRKLRISRPDFGSETIVFEGPANRFLGAEAVGGYLFLTDARLFFRSHHVNFQNHELALALADIERVEATKTLGLIQNGLLVWLRSGKKERFVVNNHATWRNKITAANNLAPGRATSLARESE